MIKKIFSFGVIVLLLLVFFSGCLERDVVEEKGEIRYVDLEGGFYGIISYDGEKYDPVNLPNDFKIDGLHVRFRLRVLSEENSFHMWGKVVYLIEIEKISANGRVKNFTGCKSFFENNNINNSQDCIKYNYDGVLLLLKHINAGFNCCPNITANFTISDNKRVLHKNVIKKMIRNSRELTIAVAFLKISGLKIIRKEIEALVDSDIKITFIAGLNFYQTEPDALFELLNPLYLLYMLMVGTTNMPERR